MKALLEKAERYRKKWGFQKSDSYRMVDGNGDGIRGLYIDYYAGNVLIQTKNISLPPEISALLKNFGWNSLYWKQLDKVEKHPPLWIKGTKIERPFLIQENGAKFLIDFQSGYSQGIFLDQRVNRLKVKKYSQGKKILNCFSYTCGFSVMIALGGGEAHSIDLSKRSLERGKQNFLANQISPERHFSYHGDVFEWLKRFRKKNRQFDGIILDPPTFSRNKKGDVFQQEKNYAELLQKSLDITDNSGWLLVCSNCLAFSPSHFQKMVEDTLSSCHKRATITEVSLPRDFTENISSKTLWIDLHAE